MAIDPCNPTGCIPQFIDANYFYVSALERLGAIYTAVSGGGGIDANVNIDKFGGTSVTLGQKAMAASIPVVVSSDQSNLPINITQVLGAAIAQGHGTAATVIRVELPTDGTGVIAAITTSITPGTAAANLGKAQRGSFANGDTGVAALGVRTDVVATRTTGDGQYEVPQMYDGRFVITNRDRISTGTIDMTNTANVSTNTLDCDGMSTCTIQLTRTTETGTIEVQFSLDGTTFKAITSVNTATDQNGSQGVLDISATIGQGRIVVTNSYIYTLPCAGYKSIRLKCQATGVGAALPITMRGSPGVNSLGISGINPGTTSWNLGKQLGVASATNDVGVMPALYREAVPSSTGVAGTDGQYSRPKVNTLGETWIQRGGASFLNILTATTTTVKSGAGILHRIVVNKAVATGTYTIYDNTAASGTKIGTVTQPASVVESQDTLEYGVKFSTGLTIVTSSTDDITVVYT